VEGEEPYYYFWIIRSKVKVTITINRIFDKNGTKVKRAIKISKLKKGQTSKGDYAHYMQKEIFEAISPSSKKINCLVMLINAIWSEAIKLP
jgi:glucosamine 6-phosphate synthetase-like amidotransferase/phosphosugar isomerase protein